jgi:predicted MPP superfamily phosphohydrolase
MSRPPNPAHRFQLLVLLVATAAQLPAVLWLSLRTGTPLPVLGAAAVSLPYLRELRTPWHATAGRLRAYLALGWWAACLVFAVLMLPAHLLVRLGGLPEAWVWGTAGGVALLAGADAVGGRPRVKRRTVRVEGLAPELDGYRIGQLSDVHCGPNVSEATVGRWVARLNRLELDLVAVTGDLITHGSEYVEAVARALGGLRARDGAYACMGNHDYFTDGEHLVGALERRGLTVLRNRGVVLARGGARLFVAGVDDTWTSRANVARALAGRPEGVPTVLLAHDPDLFPQAEARGVELTLSGHTHGGQLAVPGVRPLSLARLMTRWTHGMFRRGRSFLYVNRGAGTTGPPVRLGASPELTVLTLRRA